MGRLLKKKPGKAKKKKVTKSEFTKILEGTKILDESKLNRSDAKEIKYDNYAQMYGGFDSFKGYERPETHDEPEEENDLPVLLDPGKVTFVDTKHSKYYMENEPLVSAEPSDPPKDPDGYGYWHDSNDLVVPKPEYVARVRSHEELGGLNPPSEGLIYTDTEAKIEVTSVGDEKPQWVTSFGLDSDEVPQHGIGSVRAKILNQYMMEGSLEARHHMTALFDNAMGGYWHELSPEMADTLIEWCRNNLEPGQEGSCIDFWEEI